MDKKTRIYAALVCSLILAGCQATGEAYRSDVYSAGAVNQAQEVKTVQIVAVMPARVAVSNAEGRSNSQAMGAVAGILTGLAIGSRGSTSDAVLGGVAGGIVGASVGGAVSSSQTLVDGVQITFRDGDKLFNSAQVGRVCEYKVGTAIMVSPRPNETRIQPNNPAGCPKPEK